MSSFKPVDYSNNTPIDKSEQRQQQLPSPRQPYPHQDHYLQQQRQHQHQQHPAQHPQHPPQHPSQQQHPEQYPRRHQDMYDMQQHNAGLLHGPRMMARMDGEEEEMVVIGSGISGSFEPRAKPRVPMRLPNLDYKYPKASAQNFSPGTSLIFNAYRGHGGLLTQPYMAAIENGAAHDESYQETRRSISHEAHAEQQQQQQLTYQPHESNSYSSSPYRQQKSLEHPSYRTPHEHSFHSYQANGQPDARDYRDYHESRESRDPREYENPGIRSSQRSPGMTPPSSMAMSGSSDQLSHRIEQGHEGRARAPEHYEPHRSRDDYSSQLSTQPPRRIPSDAGHNIPPPQRWKGPDGDQGNTSHSYDGNNQYQSHHFQSQPQPQQQQQQQQQPPHPTPPMDIPQPRHRGSTNYPNEYNHRESMDHSMRGQQSQYSRPHHAQYPHSQHSEHAQHAEQTMGQGSYQSFGPRSTGPRYALTRVNYRMIFEYASEIRECLIKGKVGTTDRLLYNAEILSKVFMGCRSDIDPNAPPEEDTQAINPHQLRCTSCYIVKTPEWRKGPLGPRTLCNACGLIWGKMSRSKAATKNKLESAPKTESSESTNDTQMADERGPGVSQTLNPPSSMDGSRKRGRDTSMADEDDAESSAREEDRKVTDQSNERLTTQAMDYQEDSSQSTSQMNSETKTSGDTREQDHAAIDEVDSDQDSIARCVEEAPTSLTAMDEGESRKLSLSYVLG